MTQDCINISGNQGDVIGVNVSGTGNITGKNIATGNITITSRQLADVPSEYARGLEEFTQGVNALLQKHRVPAEQIAPVQAHLKELAEEIKDVRPEGKVGVVKKSSITNKLTMLADSLVRLLPRGAEVVSAFTPLAPFSKLIGQGVEGLVKAVQQEN